MKATVSYTVDFAPPQRPVTRTSPGRIARVTRQLALAHKIDRMINAGELRDLTDAARTLGVTRARVTQIMNLLLLAPDIQEEILFLPRTVRGRDAVTERDLRPIVALAEWSNQRALWEDLARSAPGE